MIYKLLVAGAGLALSYMVARKLSEAQAAQKVRVKTREQGDARNGRLRQDPETGIYYPED